ncbi:MAG: helix-turn-helix domain-containing protein, partial [Gemmatimonadota bacterium]
RDLGLAVAAERFREDLYYRLRVIPIEIPPLRLRREDLPLLIPHILQRIGERHHRALRLAPTASRALLAYAWPGNVRELENALEFATTVCEGQTVHITDLPPEIGTDNDAAYSAVAPMAGPVLHGVPQTGKSSATAASVALSDAETAEAATIVAALRQVRFRREAAAAALGMSRTTLWRKMKQYGLSG